MPTDPLDLVDPLRLLLLLLPERYRAPVGAAITLAVASQALAASIVSRLPLSAREHPRWGRVVRALHWYSLLRMRDEKGTTKPIGDNTGPRVTVAPTRADEVPLSRETIAPPAPIAPDVHTYHAPVVGTLRAATLTGREGFDATARQELAPNVVAAARREGERGSVDVRAMLAAVVALSVVVPLGVALCGCPRMPPVSGCSPMAQTCINDSPHVCSASQRWHRAGALTCAQVGGTCAVVGGRAYCAAPVVDAGAALAADGGL